MDLFSFIQSIFGGNINDANKRKELNKLLKMFKGKYHYISKEKTILQQFLLKVWTLQSYLKVTKPILEETIFSSDTRKALSYTIFIAQEFLPENVLAMADSFTEEIMKTKIADSDNQNKTLKNIDGEFITYKNNFNSHNLSSFATQYIFLSKLYSFASFDFEGFFKFFDRTYIENQPNSPTYNPVNGTDISDNIKDLYYLIASMPAKTDITSILTAIYSRISDKDCKVLIKNATNSVNQLYKMLEDDLSQEKLLNMCRFISNDLNLKIAIDTKTPQIIDKIRKEIEENYKKTRDNVVKEITENSLEKDIKELFKNIQLEKINGFDQEINVQLTSSGYQTISYIQSLRVTKTFILKLYEPIIKETINTLLIEGYFSDQDYQRSLAESFYDLNEIKQEFLDDEKELSEGSFSFSKLETYLIKSKTSNNPQITKIISSINSSIFKINNYFGQKFLDFAPNLFDILSEYKQQKSVKITNITEIKGVMNKDFISKLVDSYNYMAKYCKIMKPFLKKKPVEE